MCNECEKENVKQNKYFKNNSISLIETHPHLVKEWDWEENDKLGIKPENVTYGSNKKVYWICSDCKKSYDMYIKCRTKTTQNYNCPYCSGHRVCLENCLAILRPDIAKEWDYKENKNLTPFDFTARSNEKVCWICPDCSMKYDATINHRTDPKEPRGCPYCRGIKVCLWNCLATLRSDLAIEWDYEENKGLTPFDVTRGCNKKVYWICPDCNQSYYMKISNRVYKNYSCPYCSGRRVCLENCLATLRPDVAKEWHPTLNENLTPFNVTISCGKKIYWICDKGHEWINSLNSRIKKNHTTGCPECNIFYHEVMCREIMKEIFNKDFDKYRDNTLRNNKNNYLLELDCYNAELRINIEYDGEQHYIFPNAFHKNKEQFKKGQQNDAIKDQWCLDNNILQIRVSYKYDTKEEIENFIKEQLMLYNKL